MLNVGSEAGKGNSLVQATAKILEANPRLNYQGFIEGDAILKGVADVIVCDGFSGNVALKACEGVARHIYQKLAEHTAALNEDLAAIKASIQPSLFNGAYLLGINGVVVKSHGGADIQPDEQSEVHWHTLEQVRAMAVDGRIRDAKTLVALYRFCCIRWIVTTRHRGRD